ncbi:MAG: DEAD/DEAH box helicase family protein, partial [Terrimonas ferruginea]|uniref:SNF2-related protein n=1 Tax=Terrimonas ferruginea TaxID=249 RepID=UPI001AD02968
MVDPTNPSATAVILSAPTAIGGEHFYLVRLSSGDETYLPEGELARQEVDRSSPVSWLTDRPLLDPAAMARAMTVLKSTSSLTDILYSLSASRTLFRVHQFKPVLKVIDSPRHRLLLADEVGLGKTIEAGLVWTELAARTDVRRVLILCPSGLREKWRIEMRRRFDRDLKVMDRMAFAEWLDTFAEIGLSSRLEAVASFAQLRSDDLLEKIARVAPHFDLVIVDEAHALRNPDTKTHQLGELLAQNSDALLLLSATVGNSAEFVAWLAREHDRKIRLVEGNERRVPLTYEWVPDKFLNEHLVVMAGGDEEGPRTHALVFCFDRDECWSVAENVMGKDLNLSDEKKKELHDRVNALDLG